MKRSVKVVLLLLLFIAYISTPIVILILQPGTEGRGFWREFSVAIGFAGIALMGMQFIPTARLRFVVNVFPTDALYMFHHRVSIAGFIMGLAHPLILFIENPYTIQLLNIFTAPWRARAAVIGVLIFIALVVTSVWRPEIKLKYEHWRLIHYLSAVFAAGLVIYHMFGVNNYMSYLPQRIYWIVTAILWFAGALYVRLLRPLRLVARPYRVVEVEPRRNDSWHLALEPVGHKGFEYKAGQFAWITAHASPFSLQENPFSMISSAERRDCLEFLIQEFGDFTSTIKELEPGERVYVDGPFGTFDIEEHETSGYCMIAGGIGIAPILSILRTMNDRNDDRYVLLIYANPRWEDINYREEIEAMSDRMNVEVVHVLEEPPDDWEGEVGFVTKDILDRHLPENRDELRYFVCGPIPMITFVKRGLKELGIPMQRVHTERYEMA